MSTPAPLQQHKRRDRIKPIKLAFATLCLATSSAAFSAEQKSNDIIISATKIEKTSSTLTQSVTVVTEEEIKERGFTNVTEVLRQQAGIEFKKVNGPGHFSYIKMRGFSTGHILLVIDGVKISHNGASDGIGAILNQMAPESIEKIEILRGPQAALYGANSTAGVIAITTKSGSEGQPSLNIGAELGSLSWKKTRASLSGGHKDDSGLLTYTINLSRVDSDGIIYKEFFKDTSSQLKLNYSNSSIETGLNFWQTQSKFNFSDLVEPYDDRTRDTFYGFQIPDPHQDVATKSNLISWFFKYTLTDALSHKLQFNVTDSTRKSRDLGDGTLGEVVAPEDDFLWNSATLAGDIISISDGPSAGELNFIDYDEDSQQISYDIFYQFGRFNSVLGFENFRSSSQNNAYYLRDTITGDLDYNAAYLTSDYTVGDSGIVLATSIRHDNYKNWREKTTGSLGVNYSFAEASLFANFGTSFKPPKLSQTTGNYGSETLLPESGATSELGFRQQVMQGRLAWDATLWHTQLDDVIFLDRSNGRRIYNNGSEQRTQGLELNLSYSLSSELTFQGNYTHTDSEMKASGSSSWTRTVQITRNKGNAGLFYSADKLTASINAYYSGPRLRWLGDVEMKRYVRIDVSSRYHFTDSFSVYSRIENLLDEDIEEGLGYEPLGTYVVIGLDYKLF